MKTSNNTLTDNIAGINANLTGNPTVSGNQIVFTESDKFTFNISSLNLPSGNRTLRVKFTPTTLDTNTRNVIGLGSDASSWSNLTTCYITSEKCTLQHSTGGFIDNTVGFSNSSMPENRLSTAPVIGQEYELVISENTDGNIRWYIDGVLVQDGKGELFNPLYISNAEGTGRFIGSYSLIEMYDVYCETYQDFTNMINNTSGDI